MHERVLEKLKFKRALSAAGSKGKRLQAKGEEAGGAGGTSSTRVLDGRRCLFGGSDQLFSTTLISLIRQRVLKKWGLFSLFIVIDRYLTLNIDN